MGGMRGDTALYSLSPLDGRYLKQTVSLRDYFSEAALIRYRVWVEIKYLIELVEFLGVVKLNGREKQRLEKWAKTIGEPEFLRVKEIEGTIKHDVKAVEYLITENLEALGLKRLTAWVHWGLTSEDVNNLAYGLMMQEAGEKVIIPLEEQLLEQLLSMAERYAKTVMPGRTHGQIAVPTTVGKELVVFASRASMKIKRLREFKQRGKLNGAVGNFNAQVLLFPKHVWVGFSDRFIKSLGLEPTLITTQIEPATQLIAWLSEWWQLNLVWLDLARDAWFYIALDYWRQKVVKEEVGSSTMPHKVNPIDFENAEGNLELANGLTVKIMERLGQSRLQRDLSDSTIKRNLGVALGYGLLAVKSLKRGLKKVAPNQTKLEAELRGHPEMLAEATQLYLKLQGQEQAYERVKAATRGESNPQTAKIKGLTKAQQETMAGWLVEEYVGLAPQLTLNEVNRISRQLAKGGQ